MKGKPPSLSKIVFIPIFATANGLKKIATIQVDSEKTRESSRADIRMLGVYVNQPQPLQQLHGETSKLGVF